jgi:transcriptional regulator with XRE-family HTH domain
MQQSTGLWPRLTLGIEGERSGYRLGCISLEYFWSKFEGATTAQLRLIGLRGLAIRKSADYYKLAMTFGKIISESRKRLGLSQKDLAARIKKEDGAPISAQYLNDIEHNRRNAPTGSLILEFARELKLDKDFLTLVAGTLPEDLQNAVAQSPERVAEAIKAFRRTMKGK